MPDEKLEEVFSKFGKITSYKLVSSLTSFYPHLTSQNMKVKDRESGDKDQDAEGAEGVEDSGECKNKGYGFVSFQASNSCNRQQVVL